MDNQNIDALVDNHNIDALVDNHNIDALVDDHNIDTLVDNHNIDVLVDNHIELTIYSYMSVVQGSHMQLIMCSCILSYYSHSLSY